MPTNWTSPNKTGVDHPIYTEDLNILLREDGVGYLLLEDQSSHYRGEDKHSATWSGTTLHSANWVSPTKN